MGIPPGSQLYNYDANGNAKMALVNGSGGFSTVANMAALQALAAASLADGQTFILQTDGSEWRYAAASTLTSDTGTGAGPFFVATATTAGVGAFLRVTQSLEMAVGITFATADLATLYTLPVGLKLRINKVYWEVTTSFTGGTSSAIGVASGNTNFNTAGDLLGGSSGDLAATLVSTGSPYKGGTIGTKFGSNGVVALVGGDTVKFNRITSVFTAGAGNVRMHVSVITMPAA